MQGTCVYTWSTSDSTSGLWRRVYRRSIILSLSRENYQQYVQQPAFGNMQTVELVELHPKCCGVALCRHPSASGLCERRGSDAPAAKGITL